MTRILTSENYHNKTWENWPYFWCSLKHQNICNMIKSFKIHIQQLLKIKYLNAQLPVSHGWVIISQNVGSWSAGTPCTFFIKLQYVITFCMYMLQYGITFCNMIQYDKYHMSWSCVELFKMLQYVIVCYGLVHHATVR